VFYLRPSQGDFPPEETFFPFRRPPPILEEVAPTEEDLLNDPSMVWSLDESLTQRERWLSLRNPPDFVATMIATEGLKLFFKRDNKGIPLKPPLSDSRFPMTQFVTSDAKIPILRPFVEDWLGRNILTKSRLPPRLFLSRLFYVKKKNGKFRPILDLSRLNIFVQTPSFAMETLDRILKFVTRVMWAASLDVTDAFLSVPIHPDFQKYFCFLMDGEIFMFLRLPFGLTTAPWAFTRVMRPIKGCLRLRGVFVTSYLDDFLVLAVTRALCALHSAWTEKLLIWLGFDINYPKSSLVPSQSIEYLGILLNLRTLTLALPSDKVSRILALCQESSRVMETTRRELEALVGLLNFAHPILSLGRMWLQPLILWMNEHSSPAFRDTPFPTDVGLSEALRPFLDAKFLATPISFRPPVPFLDLATDASDYGWSGVIGPITVHDSWTQWEQSNSINWREIRAILNSVSYLQDCLAHRTIRIHTDSMVALFCLKRMGSLHSAGISATIKHLLLLCQERNIIFVPVHISGCLNVLADQASRSGPIQTEWCLDPDTFDWIFQECPCSPQVDLFATRANFRFARYVSPCPDPGAFAQDALKKDFDWNQFQCIYAFPPPAMMPLIMDKICSFQGTMVLIAPALSEPWLPRLQSRAHRVCILPESSFLFQIVDQEVIYKDHYYWKLSLWQLFPTQLRVWSGNL